MTVRHRPAVERTRDGTRLAYQARCTCGYRGWLEVTRRSAEWELAQHVRELPRVPAAQQCRDPRRHDRRPWEPCALCEAQTPLFDL